MSTAAPPAAGKTSFGGLSDQDRIFQNIYGVHDTSIKVRGQTAADPGRSSRGLGPPRLPIGESGVLYGLGMFYSGCSCRLVDSGAYTQQASAAAAHPASTPCSSWVRCGNAGHQSNCAHYVFVHKGCMPMRVQLVCSSGQREGHSRNGPHAPGGALKKGVYCAYLSGVITVSAGSQTPSFNLDSVHIGVPLCVAAGC